MFFSTLAVRQVALLDALEASSSLSQPGRQPLGVGGNIEGFSPGNIAQAAPPGAGNAGI